MEYHFLSEEEQHDMLVSFAQSQERDHFWHSRNRERFEEILKSEKLSPDWRRHIEKMLVDTDSRLNEVTHILENTRKQLPDAEKAQAAMLRVAQKDKQN